MKYRTIVVDPPWDYEGFATAPTSIHGTRGPVKVAALPYESMTAAEIGGLPVRGLADRDCRLFLWTTNRYLPEAFDVITAWGFNYKQTLVWRKTGNPSPFGGSVAPNHAEYLVVAAIGAPPVNERLKSSVIDAPAPAPGKRPGSARSHSAKPECFLDYIEQVSEPPYLEMFARRARFGWDYYGDQSLGTAELPSDSTQGRAVANER